MASYLADRRTNWWRQVLQPIPGRFVASITSIVQSSEDLFRVLQPLALISGLSLVPPPDGEETGSLAEGLHEPRRVLSLGDPWCVHLLGGPGPDNSQEFQVQFTGLFEDKHEADITQLATILESYGASVKFRKAPTPDLSDKKRAPAQTVVKKGIIGEREWTPVAPVLFGLSSDIKSPPSMPEFEIVHHLQQIVKEGNTFQQQKNKIKGVNEFVPVDISLLGDLFAQRTGLKFIHAARVKLLDFLTSHHNSFVVHAPSVLELSDPPSTGSLLDQDGKKKKKKKKNASTPAEAKTTLITLAPGISLDSRADTVFSTHPSSSSHSAKSAKPKQEHSKKGLCLFFNGKGCRHAADSCEFLHVCSKCQSSEHAATACVKASPAATEPLTQKQTSLQRLQTPPTTLEQGPLYKTRLCRLFASTSGCLYADRCLFAHGEEELNQQQKKERAAAKAAQASTPTARQSGRRASVGKAGATGAAIPTSATSSSSSSRPRFSHPPVSSAAMELGAQDRGSFPPLSATSSQQQLPGRGSGAAAMPLPLRQALGLGPFRFVEDDMAGSATRVVESAIEY